MENLPQEDINKIKLELERARMELAMIYEISNAMRTTLKLDEILYIILTGVTAHIGLGFNRALLFLINEPDGLIEGRMGIGPDSDAEANRIWRHIEKDKMDLDDLINAYKICSAVVESGLNQQVRYLKVPLKEQTGGLLALVVLEGMPLHLTPETIQKYSADPIIKFLGTQELVIVPLKAKDKINGLILADNFVTKKPIGKDDMRMLSMLANQAGLAIENSQLYEKTVIRAHSDYLTGLWNHGYFQYILQVELEKAKAMNAPLSLIMLDIDDFKVYNDACGHQAGDKILQDLAGILRRESRKMDHICRYGGEEFTIVLPQTNKQAAFAIADRLRQNIQNYTFAHQELLPHKKLTASIGLACFPQDGATAADLIAYSDKALYRAKHEGKNTTSG